MVVCPSQYVKVFLETHQMLGFKSDPVWNAFGLAPSSHPDFSDTQSQPVLQPSKRVSVPLDLSGAFTLLLTLLVVFDACSFSL